MMLFFVFLSFQILVMAIGIGILLAIGYSDGHPIKSAAIGYLTGLIAFSFYVFLILILGGRLSFLLLLIFFLFGIGGTAFLIGRTGIRKCFLQNPLSRLKTPEGWRKISLCQKVLISIMAIFLIFKLLIGLWFVFNAPAYFDDAIANWNIRAKTIYLEKKFNFNQENKEMSFLGGGRYFYPFFTVTYKAGLAQFTGQWHEGYANTLHYLIYLTLIVLFFIKAYEYSEGELFITSVFTFIASSAPLAFFHSFTAHSDMIIGSFFALTLIFFVNYIEKQKISELILSGIFLFGASFTKNEGLVLIFLSVSLTATIFSFRWKNRHLLIPLIIAFVLMLPHNLLRILYNLKPNAGIDISIGYHKHAATMFKIIMTEWGHSNILWFVVPVTLILFLWRIIERREIQFAAAMLFSTGFLIFLTYSFTSNFIFLEDQTSVNRALMMYSFPLVYFLMMIASSAMKRSYD